MIIWGGTDDAELATGGRYDPLTDSWSITSSTGAPAARRQHTAVWTGGAMIIWGGNDGSYLATGGLYDPAADAWAATDASRRAGEPRSSHPPSGAGRR